MMYPCVKHRIVALALCIAASLAVVGCPQSAPTIEEFSYGGLVRKYKVHVSALYDKDTPAPLLVVLHGMGQKGDDVEGLTGLNNLADEHGFLAVYPDAYQGNWNDARAVPDIPAYDLDVDDVGFILAVIDRVAANYNVDAARVYAAGMSNGAMMAYRLACEAPGVFAAAAAVAGAMPENLAAACAPSIPIPMVMINGTADPVVPWDGGPIMLDGEELGVVLSVLDSVALWVTKNGAAQTPEVTLLPDAAPEDGVRVYKEEHAGFGAGAEVVLYRIEGGGHTWPGGAVLFQLFLGPICQDINASSIIWEFCSPYARP